MKRFIPVFILLATVAHCSAILDLMDWVTLSRCRASCVQTFTTPTTKACARDTLGCKACWVTCAGVYRRSQHYQLKCKSHSKNKCHVGCKTACRFINTYWQRYLSPSAPWTKPAAPAVRVVTTELLQLSWVKPEPSLIATDEEKNVVFTVLWRSAHRAQWRAAYNGLDLSTFIKGNHQSHRDLEFRILAVSSFGMVTEQKLYLAETMTKTSTTVATNNVQSTTALAITTAVHSPMVRQKTTTPERRLSYSSKSNTRPTVGAKLTVFRSTPQVTASTMDGESAISILALSITAAVSATISLILVIAIITTCIIFFKKDKRTIAPSDIKQPTVFTDV